MNDDILGEILKYVGSSVNHKKINSLLVSSQHMKRKLKFVSNVLETKLSLRPTIDDLREKNILKTEEDILKVKEAKEQVDKLLQAGVSPSYNRCVAPSISNLVKKMDFEYKKILILHKLGIKRGQDL